jgi:hypothetical protein
LVVIRPAGLMVRDNREMHLWIRSPLASLLPPATFNESDSTQDPRVKAADGNPCPIAASSACHLLDDR